MLKCQQMHSDYKSFLYAFLKRAEGCGHIVGFVGRLIVLLTPSGHSDAFLRCLCSTWAGWNWDHVGEVKEKIPRLSRKLALKIIL
jgi:hypothetical protein